MIVRYFEGELFSGEFEIFQSNKYVLSKVKNRYFEK